MTPVKKTPKAKKSYRSYDVPPDKAVALAESAKAMRRDPPLKVAVHHRKDPESLLLETIEQIEPGCTLEPIARGYGLLQALGQAYDRLRDLLNEATAEKVRADGPFVLGEEKFYVGPKTTVKCRDVRAVYPFLLKLTEGDEQAVLNCLASDAWKHGAVRSLIAERILTGQDVDKLFDDLFETKTVEVIKTGKPTRKDGDLQRISVTVLARLKS